MTISTRQVRRAQERAQTKISANIKYAGFFYSPTDSVNNVLSITFGNCGGSALPVNLLEYPLSAEYIRLQDKAFAEDPSMKDAYFAQLDNWLSRVNAAIIKNSSKTWSNKELSEIVVMAGNIYWLTIRGFLKQSEYNGTVFA